MKKVLAIDMGATSIRGIVGYIENGNLVTKEVMRLPHKIIKEDGVMKWEFDKILDKIVDTIAENANDISSVGIDTWGVDFGLLDENGDLVQTPMSYREPSHEEGYKEAVKRLSEEEIFLYTGNQIMSINTLFQLLAFRKNNEDKWARVNKILMLPDLIQYMLTGNQIGEETIWSTSQILNLEDRSLSLNILSKMNLDEKLFPSIVKAGEKTGNTKNSRIEKLKNYDIDVISVCGHDTASAVLLTEAFNDRNCMFLSCGTWSLIGASVSEPIINRFIYSKALTNELGYDSKAMFFKNITGLFLIEKYKEQLEQKLQRKIEFDEITSYVENSKEKPRFIDMDYEVFASEDVDVKAEIDLFLKLTKQDIPKNDMDYFKVIYTSLVKKYLFTRIDVERFTKKKYDKIHIIGGGAKSPYLCQLVSDTLKLPVIAGPYEATALGNILVQLKALKEIDTMAEGIELVKKSQKVNYYKPNINKEEI